MTKKNKKSQAKHAQDKPAKAKKKKSSVTKDMAARKAILAQVAVELKQELFGIDDIIDQTIRAIRAWYVWPEIISRPVIVCLWGLTGTGKTQLVRSLVKKLNFYDRFLEVQMDGFSHASYQRNTISGMLGDSSIEEGEVGVLLLDEFQRYRTVDKDGDDVKVERYQDVWALLSDGKLSPKLAFLQQLETSLAHIRYEADNEKKSRRERKAEQKKEFKLDAWDAVDLKEALKLKESLLEIMRWSPDEVHQRIQAMHQSQKSWETDYSKLLIFIAGNLDEMYQDLAKRVGDCDTDADVFHGLTKKLSIIDVKKALTKRFRPEQIARLGNGHIIYPSLSRSAYQKLIDRTCDKYLRDVVNTSGLTFVLSDCIQQEIYNNAVFPAQGTRPVFSTIHNVLSSTLVDAALWVMEVSQSLKKKPPTKPLKLALGRTRKKFELLFEGEKFQSGTHFQLNQLRKGYSKDYRTLLAVHEAGHGLIYGVLMQHPPQEIRINAASFSGGYNLYVQRKAYSKRIWRNYICVSLAGRVAEQWVFGEECITNGAYEDYRTATDEAAQYVRHFGFGERISHTDVCTDMGENVNTDVAPTNQQIEAMLQEQYQRADTLLKKHKNEFRALVNYLLKHSSIPPEVFAEMLGLPNKKPNEHAMEAYDSAWQGFLSG